MLRLRRYILLYLLAVVVTGERPQSCNVEVEGAAVTTLAPGRQVSCGPSLYSTYTVHCVNGSTITDSDTKCLGRDELCTISMGAGKAAPSLRAMAKGESFSDSHCAEGKVATKKVLCNGGERIGERMTQCADRKRACLVPEGKNIDPRYQYVVADHPVDKDFCAEGYMYIAGRMQCFQGSSVASVPDNSCLAMACGSVIRKTNGSEETLEETLKTGMNAPCPDGQQADPEIAFCASVGAEFKYNCEQITPPTSTAAPEQRMPNDEMMLERIPVASPQRITTTSAHLGERFQSCNVEVEGAAVTTLAHGRQVSCGPSLYSTYTIHCVNGSTITNSDTKCLGRDEICSISMGAGKAAPNLRAIEKGETFSDSHCAEGKVATKKVLCNGGERIGERMTQCADRGETCSLPEGKNIDPRYQYVAADHPVDKDFCAEGYMYISGRMQCFQGSSVASVPENSCLAMACGSVIRKTNGSEETLEETLKTGMIAPCPDGQQADPEIAFCASVGAEFKYNCEQITPPTSTAAPEQRMPNDEMKLERIPVFLPQRITTTSAHLGERPQSCNVEVEGAAVTTIPAGRRVTCEPRLFNTYTVHCVNGSTITDSDTKCLRRDEMCSISMGARKTAPNLRAIAKGETFGDSHCAEGKVATKKVLCNGGERIDERMTQCADRGKTCSVPEGKNIDPRYQYVVADHPVDKDFCAEGYMYIAGRMQCFRGSYLASVPDNSCLAMACGSVVRKTNGVAQTLDEALKTGMSAPCPDGQLADPEVVFCASVGAEFKYECQHIAPPFSTAAPELRMPREDEESGRRRVSSSKRRGSQRNSRKSVSSAQTESRPVLPIRAGRSTVTATGTEIATVTGTETGIRTGTGNRIGTGTEAETGTGTETRPGTETGNGSETGNETGNGTGTRAGNRTGTAVDETHSSWRMLATIVLPVLGIGLALVLLVSCVC